MDGSRLGYCGLLINSSVYYNASHWRLLACMISSFLVANLVPIDAERCICHNRIPLCAYTKESVARIRIYLIVWIAVCTLVTAR
ncbi:hypothetical protein EDC04DRAFT_2849471 [Pisolithus marmoratus]|nr:hypothetical protein EDC04DRAFT_2849471 [Pisolithus marmoratus]